MVSRRARAAQARACVRPVAGRPLARSSSGRRQHSGLVRRHRHRSPPPPAHDDPLLTLDAATGAPDALARSSRPCLPPLQPLAPESPVPATGRGTGSRDEASRVASLPLLASSSPGTCSHPWARVGRGDHAPSHRHGGGGRGRLVVQAHPAESPTPGTRRRWGRGRAPPANSSSTPHSRPPASTTPPFGQALSSDGKTQAETEPAWDL